ncbi:MAG: 50S ribosomal protein L32 [Candidatus Abyssobacteria bacterium SURF_5]|uniref:Large ribosomal subunit protein bL32 n=1 Tax=Abyssobacteria bacterium (strain SURF_5) TaxID=2093360 RepID=A0A3A4NCA3_ABYX5|nr:MAG: 50S ribosomal protein L32 [Candidatus Abyssubacteria bacterium SURF_5]
MALPKRRISRTRRDKRRTHRKVKPVTSVACSNCGRPALPHRVCPECGFYKGRQVVLTTEK